MSLSLPIVDDAGFRARFSAALRAATSIHTLQINIGYVCNLACRHCHVDSSPARIAAEDNMNQATAEKVVRWALDQSALKTVDITGGSPEMNPNFPFMVERLSAHGLAVIDRCNPTIIGFVDRRTGASYDWIPSFLAEHRVEVVASLPCYLEDNVDLQRGRGAHNASVEGLRKLNQVGYGRDPQLRLNLVYNPNRPHLPPPQQSLEADYRRELRARFGLEFSELWTIVNMPIRRWRRHLERAGKLEGYMNQLIEAFNPATLEGLMCRHQISVDCHGRLYDCDFNQALGIRTPDLQEDRIWDTTLEQLVERLIATDDHCYACMAGAGSSCGGSLT